MADTKGLSELDKWIRRIFSPERVIAGHNEQSESGSDPAILSFPLAYLKDCREAAERAKSADTIVSFMTKKYPTLAEKDTLSFGAKVFTGEAKWVRKDLSPRYRASCHHGLLSCLGLRCGIRRQQKARLPPDRGRGDGYADTMAFTAGEVASGVYLVHRQDNSGIAVVPVENWNTMEV